MFLPSCSFISTLDLVYVVKNSSINDLNDLKSALTSETIVRLIIGARG